jgi:mannitol-specific phosphotransferase system IIBC component
MKEYIVDILFVLSLIALYFLPRKSEKYKLFWTIPLIVFLVNLGIRAYLMHQNHKSSERVFELENELNKVYPRKLSDEQKDKLINVLSFKSEFQIGIACRALDRESYKYAEQFVEVFEKANWQVLPINQTYLDDTETDLVMVITDKRQLETADKIMMILNNSGISCKSAAIREKSASDIKPNTIYLFVGSKLKK